MLENTPGKIQSEERKWDRECMGGTNSIPSNHLKFDGWVNVEFCNTTKKIEYNMHVTIIETICLKLQCDKFNRNGEYVTDWYPEAVILHVLLWSLQHHSFGENFRVKLTRCVWFSTCWKLYQISSSVRSTLDSIDSAHSNIRISMKHTLLLLLLVLCTMVFVWV